MASIDPNDPLFQFSPSQPGSSPELWDSVDHTIDYSALDASMWSGGQQSDFLMPTTSNNGLILTGGDGEGSAEMSFSSRDFAHAEHDDQDDDQDEQDELQSSPAAPNFAPVEHGEDDELQSSPEHLVPQLLPPKRPLALFSTLLDYASDSSDTEGSFDGSAQMQIDNEDEDEAQIDGEGEGEGEGEAQIGGGGRREATPPKAHPPTRLRSTINPTVHASPLTKEAIQRRRQAAAQALATHDAPAESNSTAAATASAPARTKKTKGKPILLLSATAAAPAVAQKSGPPAAAPAVVAEKNSPPDAVPVTPPSPVMEKWAAHRRKVKGKQDLTKATPLQPEEYSSRGLEPFLLQGGFHAEPLPPPPPFIPAAPWEKAPTLSAPPIAFLDGLAADDTEQDKRSECHEGPSSLNDAACNDDDDDEDGGQGSSCPGSRPTTHARATLTTCFQAMDAIAAECARNIDRSTEYVVTNYIRHAEDVSVQQPSKWNRYQGYVNYSSQNHLTELRRVDPYFKMPADNFILPLTVAQMSVTYPLFIKAHGKNAGDILRLHMQMNDVDGDTVRYGEVPGMGVMTGSHVNEDQDLGACYLTPGMEQLLDIMRMDEAMLIGAAKTVAYKRNLDETMAAVTGKDLATDAPSKPTMARVGIAAEQRKKTANKMVDNKVNKTAVKMNNEAADATPDATPADATPADDAAEATRAQLVAADLNAIKNALSTASKQDVRLDVFSLSHNKFMWTVANQYLASNGYHITGFPGGVRLPSQVAPGKGMAAWRKNEREDMWEAINARTAPGQGIRIVHHKYESRDLVIFSHDYTLRPVSDNAAKVEKHWRSSTKPILCSDVAGTVWEMVYDLDVPTTTKAPAAPGQPATPPKLNRRVGAKAKKGKVDVKGKGKAKAKDDEEEDEYDEQEEDEPESEEETSRPPKKRRTAAAPTVAPAVEDPPVQTGGGPRRTRARTAASATSSSAAAASAASGSKGCKAVSFALTPVSNHAAERPSCPNPAPSKRDRLNVSSTVRRKRATTSHAPNVDSSHVSDSEPGYESPVPVPAKLQPVTAVKAKAAAPVKAPRPRPLRKTQPVQTQVDSDSNDDAVKTKAAAPAKSAPAPAPANERPRPKLLQKTQPVLAQVDSDSDADVPIAWGQGRSKCFLIRLDISDPGEKSGAAEANIFQQCDPFQKSGAGEGNIFQQRDPFTPPSKRLKMDYMEISPTPVSHADRRRSGSTDGKRSRSTNPIPKAPVRDHPVPTSTSARPAASASARPASSASARPAASTSARPTASTSARPAAFSGARPAAPIPSTSDQPEAPAASISTQAHPPATLTDAVQLLAGLPPAALAAMLQQALANQAQYYPVIPVDIIVCNNVITRLPGVKFPGGTAIHDTYGGRAAPSAASYCTFTISGKRFPGVRFPGRTAIHDTYGGRAAPSAASEGPLGPNVIEEVVTEVWKLWKSLEAVKEIRSRYMTVFMVRKSSGDQCSAVTVQFNAVSLQDLIDIIKRLGRLSGLVEERGAGFGRTFRMGNVREVRAALHKVYGFLDCNKTISVTRKSTAWYPTRWRTAFASSPRQ
ncbi:hypothetical protein C8R45DRAFT_929146 [Mycena sanguinolenta]|nr:hypothetical protein C8R45DRAFT_929146 [Mycena sanguinolenta]